MRCFAFTLTSVIGSGSGAHPETVSMLSVTRRMHMEMDPEETCLHSLDDVPNHPLSRISQLDSEPMSKLSINDEVVEVSSFNHFKDYLKGVDDTTYASFTNFTVEKHERCVNKQVPKKMHFIWVTSAIPDEYVSNIETFTKLNPRWTIVLWTDSLYHGEAVKQFEARNMTNTDVRKIEDYIEDFRTGKMITTVEAPNAKSDLLRFEVVFLEGGIYMDTDAICHQPLDDFEDVLLWPWVTGSELNEYKNICNCAFGAEQHSAFLDFTLDLLFQNCENTLGGENCPWYKVGCMAWTMAFKLFNDNTITIIEETYIIHDREGKAITSQSFDNTWVHQRYMLAEASNATSNRKYAH